ncbi:MAG: site-specific integrase [Pyrinomonadaceae bacterium]|nr:site-specific integrase [Pyrinomonadaceae bacterium]MBP6211518.1 site-specific integrase [Pyrinomonadaceae bacterium]
MTKVFLREKKLNHGKRGLYLDFYPPIVNPNTLKETRREHLRIYIYEKPRNELEREHNKETKILAESIKSRRQLDLQSAAYGFVSNQSRQMDFIDYFQKLVETKRKTTSKSNSENWSAVLKHLAKFAGKKVRFANLTEGFCNNFKEYLLSNDDLSRNSAAAYFDKFKAAVRDASERRLIATNPARNVKSIKPQDTQREHLSIEELRALSNTSFIYDDLRRAALFSALTGLRYSDIAKLTWSEICSTDSNGSTIRFRQQKTRDTETLPISDEAVALLGTRFEPDDIVFKNLKYWQCSYLPAWTTAAGISRKITFHSFRHTYATLQLTLGTDIYTISKLLGHRNVRTTEIYAKVVDAKKSEAAGKIRLVLTEKQEKL